MFVGTLTTSGLVSLGAPDSQDIPAIDGRSTDSAGVQGSQALALTSPVGPTEYLSVLNETSR